MLAISRLREKRERTRASEREREKRPVDGSETSQSRWKQDPKPGRGNRTTVLSGFVYYFPQPSLGIPETVIRTMGKLTFDKHVIRIDEEET